MILLALAETDRIRGHSSINTQCTAIIIHSHPTVNYLNSPRPNSLPPSSHQCSGNTQRIFRLQICLSRKSSTTRKYSKFSGHHQQQPAAVTNSSNQQLQSTAVTSSNDQQQQSAFVVPAAPTQSTAASVSYHYGS